MPHLNKFLIMGHLTRDVELRQLPNGTACASSGMATNRKWKDASGQEKEDVLFIDVSAFGRAAEVLNQFCRKGNPLFIEGRLKLDQWEDKNGGGKRSRISVVVETFQLLGGKPEAQADAAPRPPYRKPEPQDNPIGETQHFQPDDIPF